MSALYTPIDTANATVKANKTVAENGTADHNIVYKAHKAAPFVDVAWIDDNNGMGPCKLSNSVRCF